MSHQFSEIYSKIVFYALVNCTGLFSASNIFHSKIWAENHMISEFIQQDLILSSEDPRHLPVSPHMSIKDYFIVSCKNIWPDFLVVSVSPDIKHLISMFCVQWQFPGSNTINWLITLTRLSHSTLLTSLLWYQWSRETDIKCWFLNTLFLVSKPFNQVLHQEQGSSVVGF